MRGLTLASIVLAGALGACSTGKGAGTITSDHLFVEQCWEGPLDLEPTFFASDPFQDTQQIRIQRGDRPIGVSDGVLIIVSNVSQIRAEKLGTPLSLGLPVGVNPPGFPPRVTTDPPEATLTLYLYNACHVQNGAVYSLGGTIVFDSLFSGDRNENQAADRLTDATFDAIVGDPRDAVLVQSPDGGIHPEYSPATTSHLHGSFRFYFQRGEPAQPFQ